jgi:predicted nucleotide-binding protein (sugar kinase/HSP70/actin superfamily)
MKESTEETVLLGRRFTSGKECYPCILTTGDMLRTARGDDFDPEQSAFFMPSGEGPCRFGQYNRFHRMVLDEAGFANVPIYAPNQDHRFYKELNIVGGKFTRLGWRAVVAVDLLTKILHETRPYERAPGTTDAVYAGALADVCRCIEKGAKDIDVVLKDVLGKFRAIERRQEKRPTIGLVGEIYIRSNRFSNSQLIRTVETWAVWCGSRRCANGYPTSITRARGRAKEGHPPRRPRFRHNRVYPEQGRAPDGRHLRTLYQVRA